MWVWMHPLWYCEIMALDTLKDIFLIYFFWAEIQRMITMLVHNDVTFESWFVMIISLQRLIVFHTCYLICCKLGPRMTTTWWVFLDCRRHVHVPKKGTIFLKNKTQILLFWSYYMYEEVLMCCYETSFI